jgi:hypothetical protein
LGEDGLLLQGFFTTDVEQSFVYQTWERWPSFVISELLEEKFTSELMGHNVDGWFSAVIGVGYNCPLFYVFVLVDEIDCWVMWSFDLFGRWVEVFVSS